MSIYVTLIVTLMTQSILILYLFWISDAESCGVDWFDGIFLTVDRNGQRKTKGIGDGDADTGACERTWTTIDLNLGDIFLLEIFFSQTGKEKTKNVLIARRVDAIHKFFVAQTDDDAGIVGGV